MKRLAWAWVLVSTGVVAAQQPATTTQVKPANAKATQEGVGAKGTDTQSQAKVKSVSATTSTSAQKASANTNTTVAKKPVTSPVPLHQHPMMVTMQQRSNGVRGRFGLRGHRLNPALCRAAQNHAEYMASTGSFSHDTNGGYVYRARRFGFRGNVRENIGWNYANSEQAFAAWQGSGGHLAAIVGADVTDAGFGYARSPSGQTYWVSVYGSATAADIADAKAIFDREKLAAEEAAAIKAELAAAEPDSMIVAASAEIEVGEDAAVQGAEPAGQPTLAPTKKPAPVMTGG
jgi:uncharacterized protein YkwD